MLSKTATEPECNRQRHIRVRVRSFVASQKQEVVWQGPRPQQQGDGDGSGAGGQAAPPDLAMGGIQSVNPQPMTVCIFEHVPMEVAT